MLPITVDGKTWKHQGKYIDSKLTASGSLVSVFTKRITDMMPVAATMVLPQIYLTKNVE